MDKYHRVGDEIVAMVAAGAHRSMDAGQLCGYLETLAAELAHRITRKPDSWKNPPDELEPEFETWKRAYPDRDGGQNWVDAERHFRRLREQDKLAFATIMDGTERYRRHLAVRGKLGTEYVMMASTFLNRRGFDEQWHAPQRPDAVPLPPSAEERKQQSRAARLSSENGKLP